VPSPFIAGVDIGASNVRVVIANQDGEVEARRSGPLPPGPPERVLNAIGRTIDDLVRGVWVGASVAAIGVALPGLADPRTGSVSSVANMPGWHDVAIADLLGRPRRVPVAIENDANAAAIGEGWLGVAKAMRDFVFIALGTGIGAGVVLDGRLHRGVHGLAGEVAYFRMTREQLVAGGWQHCLEAEVSGRASAAAATRIIGKHAKPADLFDAARSGDARASDWLRSMQEQIAMAVVDIAALLDPEAVVFGGGVVAAQGEWLLAPVRELVLACVPGQLAVLRSSLGTDAQLLGAVRLARARLEAS